MGLRAEALAWSTAALGLTLKHRMAKPKTKGTHVINAVKVLRQDRERALKALPPHLHKYLHERLLPSTWYPLEEHLVLLRTIATLFMPPGVDPWVTMGRGTARMDLTGSGIYKGHLRVGDPGRTLQAMTAIWRSVHDSGEVSASNEGPGQYSLTIRGYSVKAPEICAICEGYLAEAASIAGGADVQARHVTCICKNGSECVWRVTWKAV
jgi:uncharacterized protein (TIGR02265 family)